LNQSKPESESQTAENSEVKPDEKVWPADPESRMRRLEAVLFMARMPLPSRKISDLAHLEDGTQARTMIKQLNQSYDDKGRAFQIKRVGGGYQMRTRPQFAKWINRLDHIQRPRRLSAPALETLTVVAYRQPIIKADIEGVRGVSCGEMLRQLLEKGLIKIAGRSEKLGRPFLYATSKEFLTQFGLNTLNDLPRAKQLSGTGLPQWASSDENLAQSENDKNHAASDKEIQENREPSDSQPKEEEE